MGITRMSQRERLLAWGVAGIVLALFNFLFWSWLLGAINQGRAEVAKREATRKEQALFIKERDLWTKRDEWLQQHQPVLKSPAEASTLLEQLKGRRRQTKCFDREPADGSG